MSSPKKAKSPKGSRSSTPVVQQQQEPAEGAPGGAPAEPPQPPLPPDVNSPSRHPLNRDPTEGMNPTTVLTGFYGSRGERIKHVVHEGTLRLPVQALETLVDQQKDQDKQEQKVQQGEEQEQQESTADDKKKKGSKKKADSPTSSTKPQHELPGLDSVVRPSRDDGSCLESTTVTELHSETVMVPGDPETNRPATTSERTVAKNRAIPIPTTTTTSDQGSQDQKPQDPATSKESSVQPPSQSTTSSGTVAAPVATSTTTAVAPAAQQPQPPSAPSSQVVVSSVVQQQTAPTASNTSGEHGANNPPPQTTGSSTTPSAVQSSAPAQAASSTSVAAAAAPAPPIQPPEVIGLKKRPPPQWIQHKPGPNDEMTVDPANKTPKPDWYNKSSISELERTLLPEWFDGSAPHRTPESYYFAREQIMDMADQLSNRYVTATMVRRTIPGDVGSLFRLHSFLTTYSLINEDAQNDSAPTPVSLQQQPDEKANISSAGSNWDSRHLGGRLVEAVVEQSRKRQKVDDGTAGGGGGFVVDWEAVARTVGQGVTADECERRFLTLPMQPPQQATTTTTTMERSITPDPAAVAEQQQQHQKAGNGSGSARESEETRSAIREEVLEEIVDKSNPEVVSAVVKAALIATGGRLDEAQKAAITGLVSSQAIDEARSAEDAVANVLSEIVDLRMQKLENRLLLLDDIEGMLEAERVALELERRDLYTARCRHWFGGP